MWRKQIRAERAAEVASHALAKAKLLRESAMERPTSSGNQCVSSGEVSENDTDVRSSADTATKAQKYSAEGFRDADSTLGGSQVEDELEDQKPDLQTCKQCSDIT